MEYTKNGNAPILLIDGFTHEQMLEQGYKVVEDKPPIEHGCVLDWCTESGCWKNFTATAMPTVEIIIE